MSETNWSPAPWVVSRSTEYFKAGATVVRCNGNASSGVVVCAVTRTPGEAENARLIAAAPDLYEALADLDALYASAWDLADPAGAVTFFPETVAKFERLHEAAQVALAKARGES